jgi:flavin-dependent dehydrogenase
VSARVEDFDAVVVGASFAGLAAAGQLAGAGRVLLVDREPPGEGQTSACGTLLAVLERLDALDALEQVHPRIVVNAAGRRVSFEPAYPFATFDYRALCRVLTGRLREVEVEVASLRGASPGGELELGNGRRVSAPVLVDASGWRAVLTRALGAPAPGKSAMSYGLEAAHGHGGCDLEFWVRPPERPDGVLWAFPAGSSVREGIACYAGTSHRLRDGLGHFTHTGEFPARTLHGGFFPAALRDPVAAGVFVAGDAAGQCLPLTGEGIRPALVWGQEAGRQARQVLTGRATLDQALAAYQRQVLARRREYQVLRALQHGLVRMPLGWIPPAAKVFTSGPAARFAQRSYWRAADPRTLEAAPGRSSQTRADAGQCARGPAAHGDTCHCAECRPV